MSSTLPWIDAHCHLSDGAFDPFRTELYQELVAQDIVGLVLAGTDPEDWSRQDQLDPPPSVRIARVFGIHPWTVDALDEGELSAALDTLEKKKNQCQGLGEMGLDYYRARTADARDKHRRWFDAQLELSRDSTLPLILHVVRAHHESVPQLKRHRRGRSFRGLVHSFWAHADVAQSYIDMGFLLSIPPRIMKEDPHQLLQKIDPDAMVFETDTPFLNAAGECMKPTMIRAFLAFIAEARGEALGITAARQARLLSDLFPILKGL